MLRAELERGRMNLQARVQGQQVRLGAPGTVELAFQQSPDRLGLERLLRLELLDLVLEVLDVIHWMSPFLLEDSDVVECVEKRGESAGSGQELGDQTGAYLPVQPAYLPL